MKNNMSMREILDIKRQLHPEGINFILNKLNKVSYGELDGYIHVEDVKKHLNSILDRVK